MKLRSSALALNAQGPGFGPSTAVETTEIFPCCEIVLLFGHTAALAVLISVALQRAGLVSPDG